MAYLATGDDAAGSSPEDVFPDHKIGQTERYAAAAMSGSSDWASPTNGGTTFK